jgi:hypothetical protein
MWITTIDAFFIVQGGIHETNWGNTVSIISLAASMTVNALVTGLIVFRISKVFREVKGITTSEERSLGVTGGEKLRSIIFVIIESGMALFAIQLARLVLAPPELQTDAENEAYTMITCIHQMLNVIISSVIVTLY